MSGFALLVATIGEAPLSASTAILMLMLAFHSIRLPPGVPAMLNGAQAMRKHLLILFGAVWVVSVLFRTMESQVQKI